MADILTMGMDVGSTTSKCLILRGGKDIVASALIPAGTGTSGPRRALEEALEKARKIRGTDASLAVIPNGVSCIVKGNV